MNRTFRSLSLLVCASTSCWAAHAEPPDPQQAAAASTGAPASEQPAPHPSAVSVAPPAAPAAPHSQSPAAAQPFAATSSVENVQQPQPVLDDAPSDVLDDATDTSSSGAQRHTGTFVSVQMPIGSRDFVYEAAGNKLELTGVGPGINLLLGSAVGENAVFYGELSSVTVSDPELKLNGVSASTDSEVSLNQLGAGLQYYIMPANLFVGGSLFLSRMVVEGSTETAIKSETGLGAVLRAGKEFWVGQEWAIGVAGEGRLAVAREPSTSADLTFTALSIAVTGTYN